MYIYKIKNKINNKEYIGQTTKNIYERFNEHCHGSSNCVLLKKAIRKYSRENFEVKQLENCSNLDQLNEREEFWIKELNSLAPNGYNLMTGGAAPKHSEITKQKMSVTRRGKHPYWATEASRSEEARVKRANSIQGQKRSVETKEKIKRSADKLCKALRDQNGKVYRSATDAAEELNISRGNIQMVLRGKRKSAGGLRFEYI